MLAHQKEDLALLPSIRVQLDVASVVCPVAYNMGTFSTKAGIAESGEALVADDTSGEADQDRCEGGPPRPVHHLPDGRGSGVASTVQGNP